VKKKIILFIACFMMWCLLNWVPDWQHLVVGILVGAFVSYIIGDLFINRPGTFKQFHRYANFFFRFLPLFIWSMVKASLGVAVRVLKPGLPIKPGIVKVKTKLTSDTAVTFLANTITLTGGTMTVDVDRANGILYVHWIDVESQDCEEATRRIVEKFEGIIGKIFE